MSNSKLRYHHRHTETGPCSGTIVSAARLILNVTRGCNTAPQDSNQHPLKFVQRQGAQILDRLLMQLNFALRNLILVVPALHLLLVTLLALRILRWLPYFFKPVYLWCKENNGFIHLSHHPSITIQWLPVCKHHEQKSSDIRYMSNVLQSPSRASHLTPHTFWNLWALHSNHCSYCSLYQNPNN